MSAIGEARGFRREARKVRHEAAHAKDPEVRAQLRRLAAEYDADADAAWRAAREEAMQDEEWDDRDWDREQEDDEE